MIQARKFDKILVAEPKINVIAQEFGCSKVCVYNALAYRSNSKLACDIRRLAIDKYEGHKIKETRLIGS